jgi:hypothetical protein
MSIKHIMSQPLRTIEITSKQTAANFARILNMRVNQETGLIEAEHTTIDSAAIQEPRVKTFETDTTLITVTSQFNIVSNTARLTLQEDFKNGAEGNNIDPERETYKIRTSKGFFTAFRALTENLGFKIPSQDLAHITQTKTQAESFVGNHTTSLKKCLAVSGLPADHIIQKKWIYLRFRRPSPSASPRKNRYRGQRKRRGGGISGSAKPIALRQWQKAFFTF